VNKSKIIFYIIVGLLLITAVFRYFYLESKLDVSEREIVLIGKIVGEPDVRETNTKLTVKRASTKTLVTVERYPEYYHGDVLEISGIMQKPVVFEEFDYRSYLKTKGISAVMYYPKIELKNRGSSFNILVLKNRLREVVNSSLTPPQNYILGALILGDKNRIPNDFKEKLNTAGIRHLTAVSGLHIVLVSSLLMFLFLRLGFWKKQAIIFSLIFVFLFIALTGFQVSSIRAAIMGSLFLIAPLFGRQSCSIRSLILAGLIMLAINPFLLFYNAGFQLSFLAAVGIIYLSSSFRRYLKSDILAATFSAYIFTLPILIYSFNQISLVGLLTNALVLPIIPFVMVGGFAFSFIGVFSSFLGQVLSWPIWFLLTYVVKITEMFSGSWASQKFINVHWFGIIISYLVLFPVARYFKKKEIKV